MTSWIYGCLISLWLQAGALPPWTMHAITLSQDIEEASQENPLPGEQGAKRMASILIALAHYESRGNPFAKGDNGQSIGAFQVSKAWGCSDAKCAAKLVLRSFQVCAGKPLNEKLGWYASGGGTCGRPNASRTRMALAGKLARVE